MLWDAVLGLAGLYLVSSVVAHTVLWLAFGTDKSTDKTQEFWLLQNSALTALRFSLFFVHQQPSLLSSQRNCIFQVLAVQVYVSAMSGGMGTLQGIVFSLCWSVQQAGLAVWICWQKCLTLARSGDMEPHQPHVCEAGTWESPEVHQTWTLMT